MGTRFNQLPPMVDARTTEGKRMAMRTQRRTGISTSVHDKGAMLLRFHLVPDRCTLCA
ncbi:MAG: hypothetical protein FE78DRAFT_36250 [Acidomyces sp. 'richmondensis']|nr:MAG: hypothetical protein FE78DRAFT_36250 [Acidomyces sp. 'richmondensis']